MHAHVTLAIHSVHQRKMYWLELFCEIIGSFVRNFHIGFDPDYECH